MDAKDLCPVSAPVPLALQKSWRRPWEPHYKGEVKGRKRKRGRGR